MKIILVTNIPNPYRVPLFNELNRQLHKQGDELLVLFAAEKYDRRKFELNKNDFQFAYKILSSKLTTLGNEEKAFFDYGDLSGVLKTENPDLIIASGFSMATMKAWWFKRQSGCKLLIWSGSVTAEGKGLNWLRTLQRRFLIKQADAFVAYGTRSAKYLMRLGANEKRVYKALNTVDTAFFSQETQKLKDSKKDQENLKHLTFVGYLSNRKRVDVLLDIFGLVIQKQKNVVLDIIGDGSSKGELEAKAKSMFEAGKVNFYGFRQKEELPLYLAQTDLFLFQTGFDIWGLVLNEAMAAGLTCIASPNAGAIDDLIEDGQTGFVCNFDNREEAVSLINRLLDNPAERKRVGENAARFIQEKVNVAVSARGFVEAINSVKGTK